MADSFRPQTPSPPVLGAGGPVWDEMSDPRGQIRPHWFSMGQKIQLWSTEERGSIAAAAARMIADLGTTFNVYSDVGGVGQPYELDPVPLLVPAAEWAQVSAGLMQRARLIDTVLADLYGPQQLLREGLIPPDLVNSSPAFLQYARDVQPVGGRGLPVYPMSPHGRWNNSNSNSE